jgi:hypothetical protein
LSTEQTAAERFWLRHRLFATTESILAGVRLLFFAQLGEAFRGKDVSGFGLSSEEAFAQQNDADEFAILEEHGRDPASVMFCHRIGLDYVSCSPYRVPIAALAAAQAELAEAK